MGETSFKKKAMMLLKSPESDALLASRHSVDRREGPAFLKRMTDRQPNGRLCYRFWQRGGGYDGNLSESKAIYQQIDYIHDNPVRRGLCERAEDWPWSSAADYAGTRKGPLPLQLESLPPFVEFS